MRPIGIAGLQLQLGKGDNGDRIAAEIAAILVTSMHTVEKHVERIFDKLGVDSRVAAAVTAPSVLRAR